MEKGRSNQLSEKNAKNLEKLLKTYILFGNFVSKRANKKELDREIKKLFDEIKKSGVEEKYQKISFEEFKEIFNLANSEVEERVNESKYIKNNIIFSYKTNRLSRGDIFKTI